MSERLFQIREIHNGGHSHVIDESELKRRLAIAYGAFSKSEDIEPKYTLDDAIDILLNGEGENYDEKSFTYPAFDLVTKPSETEIYYALTDGEGENQHDLPGCEEEAGPNWNGEGEKGEKRKQGHSRLIYDKETRTIKKESGEPVCLGISDDLPPKEMRAEPYYGKQYWICGKPAGHKEPCPPDGERREGEGGKQMRKQKEHELKTWPGFFAEVETGAKTFEIRKYDRDFQVGDVLILQEYDPVAEAYTGNELRVMVDYSVMLDSIPGMAKGFIGMSISVQPSPAPTREMWEVWCKNFIKTLDEFIPFDTEEQERLFTVLSAMPIIPKE